MQYISCRTALLLAVSSVALAAQPTFAQGGMASQLQARFTAADKDHDGKLTRTEAKDGMPRVARFFERIDSDHTGSITMAQITALMAQHQR